MSYEAEKKLMELVEVLHPQHKGNLYLTIKNAIKSHLSVEKENRDKYDFDLPEVESKAMSKPRVHISDAACTACEG